MYIEIFGELERNHSFLRVDTQFSVCCEIAACDAEYERICDRAKELSGGNKRKLSVGNSMIG